MKKINTYITEKLHINKDIKIENPLLNIGDIISYIFLYELNKVNSNVAIPENSLKVFGPYKVIKLDDEIVLETIERGNKNRKKKTVKVNSNNYYEFDNYDGGKGVILNSDQTKELFNKISDITTEELVDKYFDKNDKFNKSFILYKQFSEADLSYILKRM